MTDPSADNPAPISMGMKSSNHFRVDVLTGRQVIVAGAREFRPNAYRPDPSIERDVDPFLEGNEAETPSERLSLRTAGTFADSPGWNLRVVPNRYPAVTEVPAAPQDDSIPSETSCMFPSWLATGTHDVVIECPDHRTCLLELSVGETANVLQAWAIRMAQLRKAGLHAGIAVFRNEGFSAGGSLAHCHSQIVATRDVMPMQQQRVTVAANYRSRTGRDLVDDLLHGELQQATRIIDRSEQFVWLCPFAQRTSWHVRAVPFDKQNLCFDDLHAKQISELAEGLMAALRAMTRILGPFSFNLALIHAPFSRTDAHRWMLEVLPRRGRLAGWELLTDVDIVTTSPESSAEQLRTCLRQQIPAEQPEEEPNLNWTISQP